MEDKLPSHKEMLEWVELAHRHICNLSSGKRKWNMSIPPRPDDSDIMLDRVIHWVPALIGQLATAREEGATAERSNWILLQEEYGALKDKLVATEKELGDCSECLGQEEMRKVDAEAKLAIAIEALEEIGGSHRGNNVWEVVRAHEALSRLRGEAVNGWGEG